MTGSVVIVRTGAANLASVRAAFVRLGRSVAISSDPDLVAAAEHVVLPGVGAFGPAAAVLHASGLADALTQRVQADKPLLGICLGLQLLCANSEESPGARGLGIIPLGVSRFAELPSFKIPHFGWNMVTPEDGNSWCRSGYAYFAHSYRLTALPVEWSAAWCDYGGPFIAAAVRGSTLACQCHPELSGSWGSALLDRWLQGSEVGEVCSC